MRAKLKRLTLLCLLACDGMPMPHESLLDAISMIAQPDRPTRSDMDQAVRDVEAAGYASGVTDDITGTSWTLTATGTHKARQLR